MAFARTYREDCGQTKGTTTHNETWWWNDDVSNSVSENQKLWKELKQRNKTQEMYLEAKNKGQRTVYQAKSKAERKRSGNVMR